MIENLPTLRAWIESGGDRAFTQLFEALPSLAVRYYWLTKGVSYPEVVYHYTSPKNLQLILEQNRSVPRLLLSEFETLNDSLEGEHAISIIKERFPDEEDDLKKVKMQLASCSFTTIVDNAQHWFAYGNAGKGISIGFRTSSLSTLSSDAYFPGLIRVCYEEKETIAFYKYLRTYVNPTYWTNTDFSSDDAVRAVVLATAKYEDFAFEEEFRIAALNGAFETHFLESGAKRVKFQKIKGNYDLILSNSNLNTLEWTEEERHFMASEKKHPIHEIIIGRANGAIGTRAISLYCGSIPNKSSKVPFQ